MSSIVADCRISNEIYSRVPGSYGRIVVMHGRLVLLAILMKGVGHSGIEHSSPESRATPHDRC